MTSEEVVLDTDVASVVLERKLSRTAQRRIGGAQGVLTFITVGELYRGAEHARWGDRRRAELVEWIRAQRVIPARIGVARRWGEMTGELLRKGRPLPVNDSWIAACCLHHDLPLVTYNPIGFAGIEGLEVIRPE